METDNPQPANSMFYTNTTFIGIDPTAGQKPFAYAALDRELSLLALGQSEIDEVLAFVAGQRQAVVAVCAPQQPNQGLMAQDDYRQSLSPSPRPGRWENFRVVEYLLRQHNISIPQTPAKERNCQNWMRMGFQLFRRLKTLGYHYYPADGMEKLQMMEIYPHACYSALLGLLPFPKNSLEGRLQRQLVLHEQRVDVPDAMRIFEEITRYRLLNGMLPLDNLYMPGELDALVAAYTAWAAIKKPHESMVLGDPLEGQIVLPVAELKERY